MSEPPLGDRLLTAREVAAWLGVSVGWIRERTLTGDIPHFKFGRNIRYERGEVRQWLSEQRRGGRR